MQLPATKRARRDNLAGHISQKLGEMNELGQYSSRAGSSSGLQEKVMNWPNGIS